MHKSKIDLPEDSRRKLAALLNARLADAIDLKLQAKQAHWNVKGPQFFSLHELFDKVAEEADGFADEIAERATALGGTAEGTLAAVSGHTSLPVWPATIVRGRDYVEALAGTLASFGKVVRLSIDQAEELGDADTADLFTGVSRAADKLLWFVEAHVQADA